MTSPGDVELAVEAGADAVGVILAESARRVSLDELPAIAAAIPPFVERIGVLADQGRREANALRALGFILQFNGDESPSDCDALAGGTPYIKAFHVGPMDREIDLEQCGAYANAFWMFDSRVPALRGGTGVAFDWHLVEPVSEAHRIVISGGLNPDNIGVCVRRVRPFAVDVRSGIETAGAKDPEKMRAFVRTVRAADAS